MKEAATVRGGLARSSLVCAIRCCIFDLFFATTIRLIRGSISIFSLLPRAMTKGCRKGEKHFFFFFATGAVNKGAALLHSALSLLSCRS